MRAVLLSTYHLRTAGVLGGLPTAEASGVTPSPSTPTEATVNTPVNGSAVQTQDLGDVRDALIVATGDTGTAKSEVALTSSIPVRPDRKHFWNRWGKRAAVGVAAAGAAVALTTSGGNQNQDYDPDAARGGSAPITEPRFPIEQPRIQGPEAPDQGTSEPKPLADLGAPDPTRAPGPDANLGAPQTDAQDTSGTTPIVDQSPDTGGQKSETETKEEVFVNDILADITLEPGGNTEETLTQRVRDYNEKNGTNIDPNISHAWDLYLADVRRVNGLGPNQPGVPFDVRVQIEQANLKDPALAAKYAELLKQPFTQVQS